MSLTAYVKQQAAKSGLIDAGVRAPVVQCMAGEMAKRLTVEQLKKLLRAGGVEDETTSPLTVNDYVERARRVGDPEFVVVTGAAAA